MSEKVKYADGMDSSLSIPNAIELISGMGKKVIEFEEKINTLENALDNSISNIQDEFSEFSSIQDTIVKIGGWVKNISKKVLKQEEKIAKPSEGNQIFVMFVLYIILASALTMALKPYISAPAYSAAVGVIWSISASTLLYGLLKQHFIKLLDRDKREREVIVADATANKVALASASKENSVLKSEIAEFAAHLKMTEILLENAKQILKEKVPGFDTSFLSFPKNSDHGESKSPFPVK